MIREAPTGPAPTSLQALKPPASMAEAQGLGFWGFGVLGFRGLGFRGLGV